MLFPVLTVLRIIDVGFSRFNLENKMFPVIGDTGLRREFYWGQSRVSNWVNEKYSAN